MKGGQKFLLDADTFKRAHRQHYQFVFYPAYWQSLLLNFETSNIASVVQVRKELLRGKDELSEWIKEKVPSPFVKGIDDARVIQAYSPITKWVMSLSCVFR